MSDDTRIRVLIAEDDPVDRLAYQRVMALNDGSIRCRIVPSLADALEAIGTEEWDLVVTDFALGDGTAMDIISAEIDVPVVVVTGAGSEGVAVKALTGGAADYLVKASDGSHLEALCIKVRDLVQRSRDARELARYRNDLEQLVVSRTEELRKNEQLLEDFMYHSSDGYVILDNELRIMQINEAALGTLSCHVENPVGVPITRIWPTLTGLPIYESVKSLAGENHEPANQVEETISPLPDQFLRVSVFSVPNGVGLTLTDISELVLAEKRLRKSERLEVIGTLAAGIAHDFNNILMAIIGYTELAAVSVETQTYDEILPALDEVKQAGNRAKALVEQILAFGRKTETEPSQVVANLIADDVVKFLRATFPSTIAVKFVEEVVNIRVELSPTELHRILMNLCTNALSAMPEGGELEIRLGEATIDPGDSPTDTGGGGRFAKITVSDTGTGMSSDTMERLFDPYFTTKKDGSGTGLGLSVVHGIVDAANGYIQVTTARNVGTTFEVYLPLAGGVALEIDSAADIVFDGNENILYIDDERAIVTSMAALLSTAGYKVRGMTDSERALEVLERNPEAVDVVVTDLTMPGLTGVQLIDRMRAAGNRVPVILCTGYDEHVSAKVASFAGVRVLIKPVPVGLLTREIRTLLVASRET